MNKIRPGMLIITLLILMIFSNQQFHALAQDAATRATPKASEIKPYPAMYWEKLDKKTVKCNLCPRHCVLKPEQVGWCKARKNIGGKLFSLVYGLPTAVHIDPIEKKPLFHFLPGTQVFSFATAGCNLNCKFCQNWQISQRGPEETQNYALPPEEVIKRAKDGGCESIAFTYTEPVVFYEYMLETAKLAKAVGIKATMHSAGFVNPEPLKELCKYLDAANIDLKGFSDRFYREMTNASLAPVLESLKIIKNAGVHLEITNLIIPGQNDDPKEIKKMCLWIKKNLGEDVPIHFSRFTPMYKLTTLPPTPVETLEMAYKIATAAGLKYVYIGNVPAHKHESTFCPSCKSLLIKRVGFWVLKNNLINGKCKFCGEEIPGAWK